MSYNNELIIFMDAVENQKDHIQVQIPSILCIIIVKINIEINQENLISICNYKVFFNIKNATLIKNGLNHLKNSEVWTSLREFITIASNIHLYCADRKKTTNYV